MSKSKTMYSSTVCLSDAFMNMSEAAQLLYIRLGFERDWDGVITGPMRFMRQSGYGPEVLDEVIEAGFMFGFDNAVVDRYNWLNNKQDNRNYRQSDRRDVTEQLEVDTNRVYWPKPGSVCRQSTSSLEPVFLKSRNCSSNGNEREEELTETQLNRGQNQNATVPRDDIAACPKCGRECFTNKNGKMRLFDCPDCGLMTINLAAGELVV